MPARHVQVMAGMHLTRTSTALRQLDDLSRDPTPSRWQWTIAKLEPTGRVVLPPDARSVTELRGRCTRVALILDRDGPGIRLRLDRRGRVLVPAWMRGTNSVVVGVRSDRPLVVVAPVGVLDGLGDLLAADRR